MIGANGVCSMATAGHYPQSILPDAENMLSGYQVCDYKALSTTCVAHIEDL